MLGLLAFSVLSFGNLYEKFLFIIFIICLKDRVLNLVQLYDQYLPMVQAMQA